MKEKIQSYRKEFAMWTTQELRIFCHFDKSLLLLTTTSTDTQRTPKLAEHPDNLLNIPSCFWYVAWSSCRKVTIQCPAASWGQADEVKQTHLALQWLMLFSTPPDTLTWQTRMNIIHPLRSPVMFRMGVSYFPVDKYTNELQHIPCDVKTSTLLWRTAFYLGLRVRNRSFNIFWPERKRGNEGSLVRISNRWGCFRS